jgi:putative ABC transport system substrate-binding protein
MRRREFIAGLGSAAAWPAVARAQQPDRMRRIGVLMPVTADNTEYQARAGAFVQGLGQLGWIIGRNVRIDAAGPRPMPPRFVDMRPNWARSPRTSS